MIFKLSLSYMHLFFIQESKFKIMYDFEGFIFGPSNGMGIIYIHINKLASKH